MRPASCPPTALTHLEMCAVSGLKTPVCASGNANQRLEHTMSAVLKLVKNAKTPKAVKAVKRFPLPRPSWPI